MIRLKGSLIFRLWLPFIVLIMLFSTAGAYYYTTKQKKVINEKYKEAIEKIGMTVMLGVEFSLNEENFNGLSRTLDFVRKDTLFDYILILSTDSIQGKQEILSVFPDTLKMSPTLSNKDLYIFKDFPYTTESVTGVIRVGVASQKINKELEQLNKPVYRASLLIFLLMISIILYIVKIITRPILKLAATISNPNVSEQEILNLREDTYGELRVLTDSFQILKVNLLKKEAENNRILNNLDDLVKARTNDLEKTQERLTKAQKAALITSFEYSSLHNEFIFSDSFPDLFTSVDITNLDDLLQLIEDDKNETIRSFFNDTTPNKKIDEVVRLKKRQTKQDMWIRILCTKTNEGKVDFIINGTIQNITKQKMSEEQILRLSLVAELTSNSVVITDADKKITWANSSFLKLTGYTMDEIAGKSPGMFQYEKTSTAAIKLINEKLSRQEVIRNIEVQNKGKDGHEYWLELNIVPIVSNGITTGYIGVEVDITERKELENELLALNSELEKKVIENTEKYVELTQAYNEQEKLAAIGEVTAGIAHDLNTPISTILLGAESLEQQIKEILGQLTIDLTAEELTLAYKLATSAPLEIFISGSRFEKERKDVLGLLETLHPVEGIEQNEIAELLVKCRIITHEKIGELLYMPNLKRLLQLTEKIETVLRLSSTIRNSSTKSATVIQNIREHIRKTENQGKQAVNLYQSIASALNIFSYSLDKKVNIKTGISETIFIEGNEIKLFQLWSNLIKNAIEAMSSTLRPELKINARIEHEQVKICFENNGPVIPEASLGNIFSRFFSTKSNLNGTGLGLTIVQNVIKEHNGTIHISSTEESTVFTVTLKQFKGSV